MTITDRILERLELAWDRVYDTTTLAVRTAIDVLFHRHRN